MRPNEAESFTDDLQEPLENTTSTKSARSTNHTRLLAGTAVGVALTGFLSFVVLTFFIRVIDGKGPWWPLWDHHLQDGQWFEATRVTVAFVALTAAGGAAYLAYRRQRTADENQKTAAATQLITAKAYKLSTDQHEATLRRELRTRFTDAASQLAHPSAAVRIAGVFAMSALADDWHSSNEPAEVQTCIDVLCGYLRLPYDLAHGVSHQTKRVISRPRVASDGIATGEIEEHFEIRQNDREVRKTIIRVIGDHLQKSSCPSWSDRSFDLQEAVLEDVRLVGSIFRGPISFDRAQFYGTRTSFSQAMFHGEGASFTDTEFHSEEASFDKTEFYGEHAKFDQAKFHGRKASFIEAKFHRTETSFDGAEFHSTKTLFIDAEFTGQGTSFGRAKFHGDWTSLKGAKFLGEWTSFDGAEFHSAKTLFIDAEFTGEETSFLRAGFFGEETSFDRATFLAKKTSFDKPVRWNQVHFDWDPRPGLAPTATKPDSISPAKWRPEASTAVHP
ncbi:pentapeptide repeat-containing protein [Rhodococcus sp. IEGM 1251]|uniref:pentapeptide repeat-containing protein n=1 Tax=unclassified Rhodococcus (in: high G+C Gram-positive bacteria) TaxID=192944 RepID=UPI0024B728D9|nr:MULTISPECIES: pentapeptide repeat-containing protein [unclassified Rhodococcus (in: high G+C Gram-positive bacteria)]MDI9966725.1 pentapeptide repeat-containing protein [Rhodococcus sp. IEGM 1251]MDV8129097.1 pentapeptide repeat-containing protein [Rhodococcus sp. IEGM 1304]